MEGELTGRKIGHYRLGGLLGRGGMGEVYCAEHTTLKNLRAIKRLNPDLSRDGRYRHNFLEEGRHAAILSHQGIASVYDTLEWDGELLLVMEYVDGHNLCDERSPMPIRRFLDFALECVEALAAAHQLGIVHRDLKPANIMLTSSDNRVKILDFGLAKRFPGPLQNARTESRTEQSERICGTLPYMAPEALLGDSVDHRADIFSLGVVFYEMVSGHHPFRDKSPTATADRILHSRPTPLVQALWGLPEELDRIVEKMLAKERDDRYATAQDLAVDLRKLRRAVRGYVSGDEPLSTADLPKQKKDEEPGPPWGRLLVVVALLLVPGVGAYWSWDWLLGQYYAWTCELPDQKVLAVLPFNLPEGGTADQAFFRGIQQSIQRSLQRLSRTYEFDVIGESLMNAALEESTGEELTGIISQVPIWTGANLVLVTQVEASGLKYRTRLFLYHPNKKDSGGRLLRRAALLIDREDPQTLGQGLLSEIFAVMDLELPTPDARIFSRSCPRTPSAAQAYFEAVGLTAEGSNAALERAADLLRAASAQETRCALALSALGMVYIRQVEKGPDTLTSARERCQEAVDLDDTLVEGHRCLAEVARIEGKNLEAVSHLRAAFFNDGTDDQVIEQLASLYEWDLKDPEAAAAVYREAMDCRPRYWWTRYRLGFLLADYPEVEAKLGVEAPQLYDEAIELAPRYFTAYTNAGIHYCFQKEWAKAQEYFQRSIEVHPSFLAYENLATSYFFQRKYVQAVENYREAIRIASEDMRERQELPYTLYAYYAEALYHAPGERENALTYFREAARMGEDYRRGNPEDGGVWRRLAVCYAFLGDKGKADEYIDRSLELDPNVKETLLKKALILVRFQRYDEAFGWLQKAWKAGVSEPEIREDPVFDGLQESDQVRFQAVFESQ